MNTRKTEHVVRVYDSEVNLVAKLYFKGGKARIQNGESGDTFLWIGRELVGTFDKRFYFTINEEE